MNPRIFSLRTSVSVSAWLLLVGQLLHIAITQLHTGGDANDHHAIFDAYAHSGTWTVIHLGQFAAMAILLGGLANLILAADDQAGAASWVSRLGVASVAATLALYGVLQAVDGVALKQAVTAWANAPEAEKAIRFVIAEAIRWLEWGLRSYQSVFMGLTLFLLAASLARLSWLPRPIGYLTALSGFAYMVQGWVAATEGFPPAQSVAIVLGWLFSLAWMTWLVAISSAKAENAGDSGSSLEMQPSSGVRR